MIWSLFFINCIGSKSTNLKRRILEGIASLYCNSRYNQFFQQIFPQLLHLPDWSYMITNSQLNYNFLNNILISLMIVIEVVEDGHWLWLVVTERPPAPGPVIRPPFSCWGVRGPPGPSTPAPGDTGPSSLSGSSWCRAAWRVWPWWWPAWWPRRIYCCCCDWAAAEYTEAWCTQHHWPWCGHWGHWHQSPARGGLQCHSLRLDTLIKVRFCVGGRWDEPRDKKCTGLSAVEAEYLRFWHLNGSHINVNFIT